MSDLTGSITVRGTVSIGWMYPDIYEQEPKDLLTIALSSARAAKPIHIRYDSKRDGWVILSTVTHESEGGGSSIITEPETLKEVAFVEAFACETEDRTP